MNSFKFEKTVEDTRIDKENGILKGVTLMQVGEAKGHGVRITKKTFGKDWIGKSYKCFISHDEISRDVTECIGVCYGLRLEEDGTKLRADFKFLDSFKLNHKGDYETLLELAETAPELLGISLTTKGSLQEEDGEDLPFFILEEIYSADFVGHPAATTTLFEEGKEDDPESEDKPSSEEKEDPEPDEAEKEVEVEILPRVEALEAQIAEILEKLDSLQSEKEDAETAKEEAEKKTEELTEENKELAEAVNKAKKLAEIGGDEVTFGEKPSGKEGEDLRKQMNAIPDFAERLKFFREHKAELKKFESGRG
ncbi:hypothetical protein [Puniceicoccus vermicola]|uniref:Uncharacterized protein n=1 Tax=Puniceicoccus vermicola TaxID=388746 RepID=A0A7X1AY07_9BACT|nr:hypothetical protein [Puniceicoccus vermicola]MBC2602078.1 hypothetical protein [Puniceicoccus vermicola]